MRHNVSLPRLQFLVEKYLTKGEFHHAVKKEDQRYGCRAEAFLAHSHWRSDAFLHLDWAPLFDRSSRGSSVHKSTYLSAGRQLPLAREEVTRLVKRSAFTHNKMDQFRICRERAKREGWQVVGTYKDAGISGASMILRPGIRTLLQEAQAGAFDVVVAEALDRVSRDQADVATLFKHLTFAGVSIVTLAEGEISELHVGLKGTMNALFLKDLADKTHRGIRGRVEGGKSGAASATATRS